MKILATANDVGPARYLIELEKYLGDFIWIESPLTKQILKGKKKIPFPIEINPDLIITGTSLGYTIDKKIIIYAKNNNIKSASIIEHWSWYKKRFELNDNLILPDYIIVNDEFSKIEAIKEGLPREKIFVGGNPRLEKLATMKLDNISKTNWIKKNKITNKKIILFISESIKKSFNKDSNDYLGYDEYQVINDMIEVLPNDFTLIIKTHPEEKNEKYNFLQSDSVKILNKMTLDEMVKIPDIIVGMASILLIELSLFRNDIISYRPNATKSFYAEDIGITNKITSKRGLAENILSPHSLKNNSFSNIFNGSGERISQFLMGTNE